MASFKIILLQGVFKLVISMTEMAKACLVTLKSFLFDVLFSKMLVIILEHLGTWSRHGLFQWSNEQIKGASSGTLNAGARP